MKVAFCIDDNLHYLPLLKVATRSLRAIQGPEADFICVYAGENKKILETLESENIPVARYKPVLNRQSLPPSVCFAIGCFLKLELALVPELANDDSVLYCDTDVLFRKPITELLSYPLPTYMGMAREHTAPFFHKHQTLAYTFHGLEYKVRMPFPIWTFSSGVVLFNLKKLRQHNLIDHFLAFSMENAERIENLDQSLLNYFFGKKITKLEDKWNSPPYLAESLDKGHIIHFHGAKPWDTKTKSVADLRINHFEALRKIWFEYLTEEEKLEIESW